MLPAGRCAFDVVDGTLLAAKTTLGAGVGIDPELVIGDEVLVVVTANQVGIGIRYGATDEFVNTALPFTNSLTDMWHIFLGCSYFASLRFRGVQMQKREADIRLGHDDSKRGVEVKAFAGKLFSEYAHGVTHIVTAGG